jgi:hypothetical protein
LHLLIIRYSSSDDCCRKRCYPFEKCGHTIEGCETNDDCQTGLKCLPSGSCFDIDECSEGVGTGASYCGSNANCVNSIGAFSCTCHLGYQTHVPNVGCSDVDECLASAPNPPAGCALRTNCINFQGNYNFNISQPDMINYTHQQAPMPVSVDRDIQVILMSNVLTLMNVS